MRTGAASRATGSRDVPARHGGDDVERSTGSALRRWAPVAVAPAVAAVLATAALLMGWQGVDLPAQLYRVGLFHRSGLTLWDSQWYGGHWTLNYSVIFPPLAGVLGIRLTVILSAATAAWAFDRLVRDYVGPSAWIGSLLFAAGTLAQVAIGQLPFLLGEAFALSAFWAARHRRFRIAVPLGLAAVLASPLAGAFLVLAAASWLVASRPRKRLGLVLLVAVPSAVVLGLGLLFPGQGVMPFPAIDFLQFAGMMVLVLVLIPRQDKGVRVAVAFYLAAVVGSFVLPTPLGGNITRLGECIGAPLVACLLWPHRRIVLAAMVIPLQVMQWRPAFATLPIDRRDPSTSAAYFTPLLQFLDGHEQPLGRVEIVPTRLHWEAAYAAPAVPLARGWERQLDTADNPIFYTDGALQPASYHAWLVDNGVRYVALPDVALDYAADAEGRLVDAGVPGLTLAWTDEHWRVFEVADSPGIAEGPAHLDLLDGDAAVLSATAPGAVLLRLRFSDRWAVAAGDASLKAAAGGWTELDVCRPGEVRLQVQLLPANHDDDC
ncbi:MAG TPA: hypothetical protein VHT97_01610 [Acidimicrobiales bacterium]|nr:hypothetical protein [Acidimicrobiales bacterium]